MENTKKVSNRTKVIAVPLAATTLMGGAFAYFTDNESKTNKFNVGEVNILLHEDQWDALEDKDTNGIPDIAEKLVPGRTVTKDPAIENTGVNATYGYLEVKVPMANIITVAEDGTRKPAADTNHSHYYQRSAGWTQLSKTVNDNKTEVTYVYYANDSIQQAQLLEHYLIMLLL